MGKRQGSAEGLKEKSDRVIGSFPQIEDEPHPVGAQMSATTLSFQQDDERVNHEIVHRVPLVQHQEAT